MLRRHQKLCLSSSVHFVTTVTNERGNWFVEAPVCDTILWTFERCCQRLGIICLGYVLMPDHFHALVQQTSAGNQVSELMRAFKHSTSRNFQLLQTDTSSVPLIWRRRFDDVPVIHNEIARTKLNYIHGNPVKRGLCETPEVYLWSSARAYAEIENGIIQVQTKLMGMQMT